MRSTSLVMAAAASACVVLLSSCGTPSDWASDEADGDLREVTVGAVPVVDVAALYVGEEQGFFEEEGLTLNIEFGQGGAALIPALMNSEYDVIYSNTISALQAIERELALVAIAEGGRSTGVQGEDHGGLLVTEDSEVDSTADLEGGTVAVNTVLGLHEIAVREAVAADGGDPEKVEFVEIDLPDMEAALNSDQVDAMATSEPFLGMVKNNGAVEIASQFVDTDPDFITALYLASRQQTEEDPELVQGFLAALQRSMDYASDNPDDVRAELDNFTEIDPDAAAEMTLTRFGWGLPEDTVLRIAEVSAEAGVIEDPEGTTEQLLSHDPEEQG